ADLAAEESQATGRARPDRTLGDDAALAALAPGRRLLDHEPALRDLPLERGVVEVAAITACEPRREPFEDAPVPADGVTASAQRQPVEINRGRPRRTHRRMLAERVPARTRCHSWSSCSCGLTRAGAG